MKFIDKKKFAKAALNKNSKIFMMYITIFKALLLEITIYFLQTTLIFSSNFIQVAALK